MRTEGEDVPHANANDIYRKPSSAHPNGPAPLLLFLETPSPPEVHRRSGYRRRPPRVADGLALACPEIPSVADRSGSSDATSSSRATCLAKFAGSSCQLGLSVLSIS
ncbi:hypothetical protein CTA1_1532 [Colletotrichum tanaceti]|uniref:Uncharacterized protein n=1 Tax=Colletotrichum tanaceti TaxID=1306861 RepID=A0A4U6X008_9PEZI|nr:hypothetical protein CTA1_1532 [Colletotrichum tanaceti]